MLLGKWAKGGLRTTGSKAQLCQRLAKPSPQLHVFQISNFMLKKQDPRPNKTTVGAACSFGSWKTSPCCEAPCQLHQQHHTYSQDQAPVCTTGGLRVPGPQLLRAVQPWSQRCSPQRGKRGEEDQEQQAKDCSRAALNAQPEHFQRQQPACCVYYERTGSPVPSGSCTRK